MTAAQLVIARQYGFTSWAQLRRNAAVVIRPAASPGELVRAFELIGARRAPTLEQDRYFLQVARRFPEDQPLMLVAELDGQPIGAGFAFRRCSQPGEAVTLRNVGVLPPHDGIGLQRRLIRTLEQAAGQLGAERVILGGPTGAEREFCLSMGYRGRHDGGLMSKALPRLAAPGGGKTTCEVMADGVSVSAGAARCRALLQRTPAPEAVRRGKHSRARDTGEPSAPRCWGARHAAGAVMPKDHDFKRLVRARMADTGERYTTARATLAAQREPGEVAVSDRARSLLGQLADIELAAASCGHLERLPEPERRAAAIEGLRHGNWRVRRTCAWLLDQVDLTPESVAALTRALDDEHPQVRRKAVHALSCENCKPNGCAVDVRPLFERVIGDDSVLVRSMVIHVVTLHFFHHQWAVDLVAGVAASDKSAKQREWAAGAIAWLRWHWDSDDSRRELAPDVVARTQRHPGHWVVVRDGRVVATSRDSKASRRELTAGGRAYWVAPPGTARPRIP